MKNIILLVLAVTALLFISCKTKPAPAPPQPTVDMRQMEDLWQKVDSLEKKGLLTSALDQVRAIKKLALEGRDSGNLVKAIVHENKYLNQLEEDSSIRALQRIENEIGTYPEPAKSVMHSLAAEWYGNYLQSQLWKLRSRTEYAGAPGSDIRTWGIRHFVERIKHHFKSSVQWDGLRSASVDAYKILLTEDTGTDHLRPTLYDILMHRAIDFYAGSTSYLTSPSYGFVLTDPRAFGSASSFVQLDFPTQDTLSNIWQTLQWFQELLGFRLANDKNEAALVDADLKRLRYIYDHSAIENKDSLYENSLDGLSQKYAGNPESAHVDFYRAQLLMQKASLWNAGNNSPHRYAYKEALEICKNAIRKFPDAYGSQLCQNLIAQIEAKQLGATVESVNLPGEELLAQIEFRNLSSIELKLVRLPEAPQVWRGNNWNGEEILMRLNQLESIRQWSQPLNDSGDYQRHTTEIALPALAVGFYALLVSDKADFNPEHSTTMANLFTVSELGYWIIRDREKTDQAAVLNRRTGLPFPQVKAEFFINRYNNATEEREFSRIGEATSDQNGWITLPTKENQSVSIRLTKNGDELWEEEGYHTYRYGRDFSSRQTTLFFTDRAIYRPGQKVFFKGYILDFDTKRVPGVVRGKSIDVTLYDANDQEVLKKTFVSNEYGTIAGQFDLPTTGLTGGMSLGSSHGAGRQYFQVEEYKRPKFEIVFDTLRESARLNEEVVITGDVKDYAGSPLGNVDVFYRVERVAYRPWWFDTYFRSGWPREEDRQVLTSGNTTTQPDGSFRIPFIALPKAGGDLDLYYRFETTVQVTDLTGESHESIKSIQLNRQGFEVILPADQRLSTEELSSIPVTAINSDGSEINVSGVLEVSALEAPVQNKRNRLWETPDVITIPDSEFARLFPDYHLPGKENFSQWSVTQVVGNRSFNVMGTDSINISTIITAPGYYKLEWEWKDAEGHVLEMTQYVMVFNTSRPLPGNEIIEVAYTDKNYMPGEEPEINLLTGLKGAPKTIRIVERRVSELKKNWLSLPLYNDRSIKISEDDRGGIHLHHLTVFNNRFIQSRDFIQVPWTNKQLKVNLKTWRDKMEPGDEETWSLTVKGEKQDPVMAELLLSMYDASLDAFVPHQWEMDLFPRTSSTIILNGSITRPQQSWGLTHHWREQYRDIPYRQYRDINVYGYYSVGGIAYASGVPGRERVEKQQGVYEMDAMAPPAVESTGAVANQADEDLAAETTVTPPPQPSLRAALDETVFFYPQITTDAQGNLSFSFKMKEGLTRWKFQALAHTKALAYGLTQAEVVTQKQLMVFPNPPRFFRQNDTIAFQTKITNLTDQVLNGTVDLKIVDAANGQDVSSQWNISQGTRSIRVDGGSSAPAAWMLTVPKDWIRPVRYQVFASAGSYTDGEEALLPVVTNRVLITETLPLPVKANETRTFVFRSMSENKSASMDPHQYTVEMTTSPAWYAVQALPYLMEYPHDCAEQIFNRLYANSLAAHIANKIPSIKKTMEVWRATESDALLSNLEKNQDLKSALLEETPWVRDAFGETSQKKDIALLFEGNRLRSESQQAIASLAQMQSGSGAWPWFPGGDDNWYITQYIVEGFGHLQKLGVVLPSQVPDEMIRNAVSFIDRQMIRWYDELLRLSKNQRVDINAHQIGPMQIHYLYTRSFYPNIQRSEKLEPVINYVRQQCEKYWLQHGIYEQGLIALGIHRMAPGNTLSADILASLRERAIVHEELGRYWKVLPGFYWYQAPVELQSLLIELFEDMNVAQSEVDEMRVWLLKNKQTNRWRSTKATSAAIYALLIHPDTWLDPKGIVEVKLGNETVFGANTATEAGTGYVKKSWNANEIKDNWSTITVRNPNNTIAWGAVYWQYWEDIDNVKSPVEENPLQVTRQLLKVRETDRGEVTEAVIGDRVQVGDKLIVRLIVESDRAMEFIHLKDLRASGFEPVDVISAFRWGGGIGYYQSTRDLATHFFIDYLPRGKFIIEYPVTVAQAGGYSEGLSMLQCMYAPEFSDHSEGSRIHVSAEEN